MGKKFDVDKAISAYIRLRDKKAEIQQKAKTQEDEINAKLETISRALLDKMKDDGAEGMKGAAGSVSRVVKTRYWPADQEALKDFIKEHDAIDLLETRIHQGNYKQFIKENPDLKPPVNANSEYAIRVQRKRNN